MAYTPSSSILFLAICSLNKATGGEAGYSAEETLPSRLSSESADLLLKNRDRARRLVRRARKLEWQGVLLSELEFNRHLVQGPDFGGQADSGAYYPALRRYEGRFFQTLGTDGKRKLFQSSHHVLFMSGLYGLVAPMEPIQLYSCPVKPQVANIWTQENVLTGILADYVTRHAIKRIIDLTAVAAYRNLIDWPELVRRTGVDCLQCFDKMSAGDYALVPFGRVLKDYLLEAPEADLLLLPAEHQHGTVVFHARNAAQPGFPDELRALQEAERELPLLVPHRVEYAHEVLGGGNPILPPNTAPLVLRESSPTYNIKQSDWLFAMASEFRRNLARLDKKVQGRVMAAVADLCDSPMQLRGDTVKKLSGVLAGKWRYRIGDYRLIYIPDRLKKIVYLLDVDGRGSIYESLER